MSLHFAFHVSAFAFHVSVFYFSCLHFVFAIVVKHAFCLQHILCFHSDGVFVRLAATRLKVPEWNDLQLKWLCAISNEVENTSDSLSLLDKQFVSDNVSLVYNDILAKTI